MTFKFLSRFFFLSLFTLCGCYLLLQCFINSSIMFSVDDFWFSHHAYRYKTALPYKDFMPYKTVLGYYFLLLPLRFFSGDFQALIYTKHVIGLLNAGILFVAACWLTRFFAKPAILLSVLLLIIAENFLFNSTNIRGDLLAYWFGLISILLLMEKRYDLAGIWLGLGFITSQKIIWYYLAANLSLGITCYLFYKNYRSLWYLVRLNIACLFIIAAYLLFWTYLSNWHNVIQSVWYDASAMYHLDWYNDARKAFWYGIVGYNPFLFLLAPLTVISLFVRYESDTSYRARVLITLFALVVLSCLIPYKQPFPYYMQATYPIFLILYSAFFTWFFGLLWAQQIAIPHIGKPGVIALLNLYAGIVFYIYFLLALPIAYLLILIVPMVIGLFIIKPTITHAVKQINLQLLMLTFLFLSIIYPGILLITKIIYSSNAYQKANIHLAQLLLQEGGDYVAGMELFYRRTQPIVGLRHLMGPAVQYLYTPTEKLRRVMIPALDEDPTVTIDSIITDLKNSQVKFYVNSYRMTALPPRILAFLAEQYTHYWGSIYLYAPKFPAGNTQINIKFSGYYQLSTSEGILFDNKPFLSQDTFFITRGEHYVKATKSFRLRLIPEHLYTKSLPSKFATDFCLNFV